LHGIGAGGIENDDLERRVREIAVINGRAAEAVTQTDRDEARMELAGGTLPPATNDDVQGVSGLVRDPSEPPSITGHQTPDQEEPDGQQSLERLVAEGAEEARHDQMLAARRHQRRQEKL